MNSGISSLGDISFIDGLRVKKSLMIWSTLPIVCNFFSVNSTICFMVNKGNDIIQIIRGQRIFSSLKY